MVRSSSEVERIKRYLINAGAISEDSRITDFDAPTEGKREEEKTLIQILTNEDLEYGNYRTEYDFVVYGGAYYRKNTREKRINELMAAPPLRYQVTLNDNKERIASVYPDMVTKHSIIRIASSGSPDCRDDIGNELVYTLNQTFLKEIAKICDQGHSSKPI